MSFDKPVKVSLKGQLLLADPSLQEPTFFQSVLLLTDHSEDDGAHGYILNRPLSQTVSELLTNEQFQGGHFDKLSNVPVHMGGPVSTEHLTFAAFAWSEMDKELQFSTHLSASEAVMYQMEGYHIRAFVGYSGWSGGQIEGELKQNAWIVRKPGADMIRSSWEFELWKEYLREVSPWHKLVADEPENPEWN